MPRYEVLPHTADTAIVAYGLTMFELFENAAFGMFDLMFDLDRLQPSRDVPIMAAGDSMEDLLVAWLEEVLYEAERRDLAFCSFTVDRLEEGGVQGAASGLPVAGVELVGPPIKAITYHDLAVVSIPDGWWARVIFDV